MAINGVVHGNQESTWGFAEETTFGTEIADNQNFVNFDGPIPTVDYGIAQDLSVRNDRGRVASSSDDYTSQIGGLRVLSFSDMY